MMNSFEELWSGIIGLASSGRKFKTIGSRKNFSCDVKGDRIIVDSFDAKKSHSFSKSEASKLFEKYVGLDRTQRYKTNNYPEFWTKVYVLRFLKILCDNSDGTPILGEDYVDGVMSVIKPKAVIKTTNVDYAVFENDARNFLETVIGCSLRDIRGISINGKIKRFDILNKNKKIVGDIKQYSYTKSGNNLSGKISGLNEYVFLMQKLGREWRKILVIGEDESFVAEYIKKQKQWLEDVEVHFFKRPNTHKVMYSE